MPDCPACQVPLQTVRQREGIYFSCAQCGGRAVTLPQIRRMTGDRFASSLVRDVNRATSLGQDGCPFCGAKMRQFQTTQHSLSLEACRTCSVVWFNPGQFEAIPESAVESTDELLLRGREAIAIEKVKAIGEEARAQVNSPEEKWKWVAGFLGMPVEIDGPGFTQIPWLTRTLSACIALVSILAFFDLKTAVEKFGLIPDQALRYGGFTFISSFFLHAGIWHLVSNLYFFVVFGQTVEDYLGRWKFALLILVSALGGDFLALLMDPHSNIPSIGASGGIAGVLAFYALEFPKARLGFYVRFSWLTLPAWGAFALWILLQVITAYMQVAGMTEISGLAHLGGAGIGLAWWVKWGKSLRKSTLAPG